MLLAAGRQQRELALRFLSWAAQVDDHRILTLYADELSRFDLPLAPDGPPEQLGSLLDALDIL